MARYATTTIVILIYATQHLDRASCSDRFPTDPQGFETVVQPFFQEHCERCHGPDAQEGDFRVDRLGLDLSQPHVAEAWHELLNRINKGEMPPEGESIPDLQQQTVATDWIGSQLQLATRLARSTGGQIVLRRLNRAEYNNTIRDLVGIDFEPAADFPEDPPAFGFDNIGNALSISPLHFEKYLKAAREVVDRAIVSGERPTAMQWHMEVEQAHPSNHFEGRDSAGKSELWVKDPHHQRHRFLLKGGGTVVKGGWLVKKGSREQGRCGFSLVSHSRNGYVPDPHPSGRSHSNA